ncbi:MAG: hypothetical protein CSYNP_01515 [Syntrophus sp. SKADARSKE-3]|nr:hypothetical protein [Syntrophus sp. SKADARSKE-3]
MKQTAISPRYEWDEAIFPVAEKLAADMGLSGRITLEKLSGGRNNRVFRMAVDNRTYLLKSYFVHDGDRRDRLNHEFSVIQYAWSLGLRSIPQPFIADTVNHAALYEFIAGDTLVASDLTELDIEQAIRFVRELNIHNRSEEAGRLPIASEACFSIREHLHGAEMRLKRLQEMEVKNDIEQNALDFVTQCLLPHWLKIKETMADVLNDNENKRVLGMDERCLSPSDFGFHNVLRERNRTLRFIDFEYAGWDDPAKLICDFFCQPDIRVPRIYLPRFEEALATMFDRQDDLQRRVRLLFPVYGIKWCCIMLNDFLPEGRARRGYADAGEEVKRKEAQLEKAEAYLPVIMNNEW